MPFPHTGKKTMQRASVLILYAEEFKKLYNDKIATDTQSSLKIQSIGEGGGDLRCSLYNLVVDNSWLQGDLDDEMDFFEAGLDSLQLPGLIKQVNTFLTTLRRDFEPISTKTVFAHSSINRLYAAIKLANGGSNFESVEL